MNTFLRFEYVNGVKFAVVFNPYTEVTEWVKL
jgi:hypothetical protein